MMWWLIARSTWRLAWREPLTRLELVMLGLLTLLAAIAAVGSPTAGDGAIEMYGVAYATTPFALVLIIGQLNSRMAEEVAWWSRPVGRDTLLWGRFVGYTMVGITLVGIMAAWGWLMMTVIAHLGAGLGALWTLWFCLLAIPSVLTIAGAALWLAMVAPGVRYFPLAIVSAVLIAFLEYKSTLLTHVWPHLPFFNPFPGFLELGLALPPPLISSPWVGRWLWLNRLWWALAGVVLLEFAIRRRHPYYPLARRRFHRNLLAVDVLVLVLLAIPLARLAGHLSPPIPSATLATSQTLAPVTTLTCTRDRVTLAMNAATGLTRIALSCQPHAAGRWQFVANGGLRVSRVVQAGRAVPVSPSHWISDSAYRAWTIRVLRSHQVLRMSLAGRPLPQPSLLPYPPFAVGQVYAGWYLGHGLLDVANLSNGLPSFLPARTPITLTVTGLGTEPTVTNAHWNPRRHTWQTTLGSLAWTTGPMIATYRGRTTVWVAQGEDGIRQNFFLPYVGALRLMRRWLPLPRRIALVPSPVTASALWHAPLLLYSTVHPYVRPVDPVSASQIPPTSYTATLFLIHTMAAPPLSDRQAVEDEVLAALAVFSGHPNNQALLLDEMRRGDVSGFGRVTPPMEHAILQEWSRWRREPLATRHRAVDALWRELTTKGGAS
ncbi:MAG: hypothetical protein OWU33_10980 [Firmicutes bacterium]|nr:hypothetical protein [Bacillota bacterium]